ncbi:PREDICTED: receptor-transporting protein 5 [Bison bison bison]|uniref:Receptor-transporting protein 5 n=1 Tax=Bison bison bison TaxID=43346 RepID=A0A6P3IBD9_BISBB|nr:PREDICTED: receptor-transporting protein 5 [Bison bison bison]
MDGADVWAKTLVQLMAQTKPKDIWELVPQENLASGHLDSSGFQYRLRGLSSAGELSPCLLGTSRPVWGPSPGAAASDKQPQATGRGSPRGQPGGRRRERGLCGPRGQLSFDMDAPAPPCLKRRESGVRRLQVGVWGVESPPSGEGLVDQPEGYSAGDTGTQGRGPRSSAAAHGPPSRGVLVVSPRGAETHAAGTEQQQMGSLYLPANSKATSKGRRFPVNIKAPVFHGKGLLLSGAKATTGFIYQGLGCVSEPDEDGDEGEGEDEGADWGAPSSSTRLVPVGGSPRPMTYIVGLMDNGEGSVTFPSSLTDVLLEDADAFDLVYGSLTFPFMFAYEGRVAASSASGPEGKGQVAGGGGPPAEGRECLPGTDVGGWVPLGEGSVTVPFSVFSIIQSKSSGRKARGPQGDGLAPQGSSKKRKQPGPRASRFRPPPPGDEGFCWAEGFCFDPYEEVWIWVSLAVCVLWIMYLCKFSPDRSPWYCFHAASPQSLDVTLGLVQHKLRRVGDHHLLRKMKAPLGYDPPSHLECSVYTEQGAHTGARFLGSPDGHPGPQASSDLPTPTPLARAVLTVLGLLDLQ